MNSGQLRVGKGYIMVTVGQQGELKENITELHIIVRTTGISNYNDNTDKNDNNNIHCR